MLLNICNNFNLIHKTSNIRLCNTVQANCSSQTAKRCSESVIKKNQCLNSLTLLTRVFNQEQTYCDVRSKVYNLNCHVDLLSVTPLTAGSAKR